VLPASGASAAGTTFERTLVDVLDAPDFGGGWEEVWRSLEMVEYFDLAAVVEHTLKRSFGPSRMPGTPLNVRPAGPRM
jgi:predicted transcriptional regulator of viral defense system